MTRSDALPTSELVVSGRERAAHGIIVTARDLLTDDRLVLHAPGSPRDAMGAVCDRLDALGGYWRVLTVSSPESIYRDLQGTRAQTQMDAVLTPEATALGRIGRADLLDPSLLPHSRQALARRRAPPE